jgi:hypothetical protein
MAKSMMNGNVLANARTLALLLVLSTSSAFAAPAQPAPGPVNPIPYAPPAMATVQNDDCASDANDPYDTGYLISPASHGYHGECLDSSKFRAAQILPTKTPNTIRMANFRHNGKFWTAEIPLLARAWKNAYYQTLAFPVIKALEGVQAGHTEIRLMLNPTSPFPGWQGGIKLTSQSNGNAVTYVNSMIYSVEAGFPKNTGYNFAIGALNDYPIVGRIGSDSQRIADSPDAGYVQYALGGFPASKTSHPLNTLDIAYLARRAVEQSDRMGVNWFYNTIYPNCTTESFRMLDMIPGRQGLARPFYTVLWIDPIVGPAQKALQARGLFGPRIDNMEQEFGKPKKPDPVASTGVQNGIVRAIPDAPFTLVTVMPKTPGSEGVEKTLQAEISSIMHRRLNALSAAAITPSLIEGAATGNVLTAVLKELQSELMTELQNINSKLPAKTPAFVVAYLAPYTGTDAQPAEILDGQFRADFPFKEVNVFNQDDSKTREVIGKVHEGIARLQQKYYNVQGKIPAFFMGAVIQMKLLQDESEVTIQTAMSLVPYDDNDFRTAPVPVDLRQIHIPGPSKPLFGNVNENTHKASMIISYTQRQGKDPNPAVNFTFGGFDRISTDMRVGDISKIDARDIAKLIKARGTDALSPDADRRSNDPDKDYDSPLAEGHSEFGLFRIANEQNPWMLGLDKCTDRSDLVPELRGTIGGIPWDMVQTPMKLSGKTQNEINAFIASLKVPIGIELFSFNLVDGKAYSANEPDLYDKSKAKELYEYTHDPKKELPGGLLIWDFKTGIRTLPIGGYNLLNCLKGDADDSLTTQADQALRGDVDDAIVAAHQKIIKAVMGYAGPANSATAKKALGFLGIE